MRAAVLAAALLLPGCTAMRDPRVGRDIALAGLAADVGTTYYRTEFDKCVENNPIYGDVRTTEGKAKLIAINGALAWLVWWAADRIDDGLPLAAVGFLRLGVAGHNLAVDCN